MYKRQLVHGSLGLGFPMLATPLLALSIDLQSAILITLLPTVTVNIVSILRGGRWGESVGRFWPMSLYVVIGSAFGTSLIIAGDPAPFKLLLAALILLYMGAGWVGRLRMGWVNRHRGWSMMAFGTGAGFAAGCTNVMVPVLIVYTLETGLATTAMVQVFNMCFLAGKLTQMAMFAGAGMLGADLLISTLPLAGVALLALLLGMALRERITSETYRLIVKGILFIVALILIAQYLS